MDNPYLAHRNAPNMATGSNGAASGGAMVNPLAGLVPRRVSVDQAKKIQVSCPRHTSRNMLMLRTAM